jgi:hypothetical protein
MIHLIGSVEEINQASNEIKNIIESFSCISASIVIISPTILANCNTNHMPLWRKQLNEIIYLNNNNIIINKVGFVNNDALTDLTRSTRALSSGFINQLVFLVDSSSTTRHDSIHLMDKYNQVNQIYPLSGTMETKKKEIHHYLFNM